MPPKSMATEIFSPRRICSLLCLLFASLIPPALLAVPAEERAHALELSRPVRPWEFLCTVGTRAGLFGNEAGRMEAWVYPLKLLRDFRLQFETEGRILPAETLARTVITRPESSTIVYTGDTFSVRETLFVPVNEPGAIISLEVETEFPLDIEASFLRDFQLEWPGALGGTYSFWDKDQRAFYLGEETKKFAAFVGSPTATEDRGEYQTNYSESPVNSFRLGVTNKGKDTKLIVIAGSLDGRPPAIERTRNHDKLRVFAFVCNSKSKRIYRRRRVVGLVLASLFRGGGRAYERGEFFGFLAEIKRALVLVPKRVGAPERGRPFKLKIAQEPSFDFQWEFGFDLEQNYCAGLAHGNEECLANGESVARVHNAAGLWTGDDCAGESFRGQEATFGVKLQAKIAQQFEWIHPSFHAAGLIAEKPCARTHGAQEFPGPHGVRQLQRVCTLLSRRGQRS